LLALFLLLRDQPREECGACKNGYIFHASSFVSLEVEAQISQEPKQDDLPAALHVKIYTPFSCFSPLSFVFASTYHLALFALNRMRAPSLAASLAVAVVAAHPQAEQAVQKLDTDYRDDMASSSDKTFDYVVVGGGTAGLALATRLAEGSSHTVAVIEAGGFYEQDNGNISVVPGYCTFYAGTDPDDVMPLVDWGFVTKPQKVPFSSSSAFSAFSLTRFHQKRAQMTDACIMHAAKPWGALRLGILCITTGESAPDSRINFLI
jgi:GMC oxidoreductase